jgi:hypothetical protein
MNRSIALKIKKTSHIESRHCKHAEKWTPSSPICGYNKHIGTQHTDAGRQTNGSNITHAALQLRHIACLHSMECFRWISLIHQWFAVRYHSFVNRKQSRYMYNQIELRTSNETCSFRSIIRLGYILGIVTIHAIVCTKRQTLRGDAGINKREAGGREKRTEDKPGGGANHYL